MSERGPNELDLGATRRKFYSKTSQLNLARKLPHLRRQKCTQNIVGDFINIMVRLRIRNGFLAQRTIKDSTNSLSHCFYLNPLYFNLLLF